MSGQTRQSIIEMNAIRLRAELALREAERVLLRANARLDLATERLIAARARATAWRAPRR